MSLFKYKKIFRDKSYWFLREVELPIDGILEYIQSTDQIIEAVKVSVNSYEKYLEEWSSKKVKKSFDVLDYYTKKFSHQLYYNSIFITEYSFLERKMLQLCRIPESKQSLKINDVAGTGIFKYYLYFEKVLKVNMEDVKSEWSEILKYNQLRNLLVHHPTYTIENIASQKSKINLLKSIQYLQIEEDDNILEFEISDKKLLNTFAEIIREFLAGIYYDND